MRVSFWTDSSVMPLPASVELVTVVPVVVVVVSVVVEPLLQATRETVMAMAKSIETSFFIFKFLLNFFVVLFG